MSRVAAKAEDVVGADVEEDVVAAVAVDGDEPAARGIDDRR